MDLVTATFRLRFRDVIQQLVGDREFKVDFYAGSVVADVVFTENNAQVLAGQVADTPSSNLTQMLDVTVLEVSTPVPADADVNENTSDAGSSENGSNVVVIAVVIILVVSVAACCAFGYWYKKRKAGRKYSQDDANDIVPVPPMDKGTDIQIMQVTLSQKESSNDTPPGLSDTLHLSSDVNSGTSFRRSPTARTPASGRSASPGDERKRLWKDKDHRPTPSVQWSRYGRQRDNISPTSSVPI